MTLHSILIQKLLSTNAHVGRRVANHHFKLFTYGIRNRQYIIDSDKTLICLRSACDFIGSLVRQKGRFMFVNTNPLFDEIVEQMTKKIGLYSPSDNILWKRGGVLTNSCSPKKFRSRKKKLCFGPIHPPDCVVIMDTDMKSSLILEAEKLQIPVVALVNSSMPWDCYKKITYPIPANDSVQFVYLVCNIITKIFLLEQKKLGAAKGKMVAEIESRKEVQVTDASKGKSKFENIELPVLSYDQLIPIPEDTGETKDLLDKLIVLKFNGALGTNIGFDGPKSAVEIREGVTSLDLIATQIESLNLKYGCNVPLLLLNSQRTHDDTLKVLEKRSKSTVDILTLKLSDQLSSIGARSSEDELYNIDEGTLVLSLINGGVLDVLLSQGKEYVLVVNSDNVGAIVDRKILNHLVQNKIECCMEVRPVTAVDGANDAISNIQEKFKLGEIARQPLRQPEKFKLVDTKTLWANLKAVRRLVDVDALNKLQEVDGDEASSSETAASSAIRFFNRATGVSVPQSHYIPLKTVADLLILQSDLYLLSEGILARNKTGKDPSIDLGAEFDKVSEFSRRFKSIPSITELDSLKVTGDVWFASGITLKGNVTIAAKPGIRMTIPDGVVLENKVINDLSDI